MAEEALLSPSRPSFNLLDTPWLGVLWKDGHRTEVGLLELFSHCREIAALAESSPPALVAVHRILLAIVHRALSKGHGRWTAADRERWFLGGLPVNIVIDYLMHWRERFWLFHPTHPFMQVAALGRPLPPKASDRYGPPLELTPDSLEALPAKGWSKLALESASGNNPVLFDHSLDDSPQAVAASVAARQMLGYLQFAPGGPVKALCKSGNDVSGPLFNSAAFIPVGDSLSETLVLSLPSPSTENADDSASWESEPLSIAQILARPTLAAGPCDRYTRLSRSVLLLEGPAGMVSRILFAEGLALLADPMAPDPMTAFRLGANDQWVRLTFSEGRAVWRDLGALLPDASGRLSRSAPVLESAYRVLAGVLAEEDCALEYLIAGIASEQAKGLRGRVERQALPRGVLGSIEASTEVRAQLRKAEEFHVALRRLVEGMTAETLPDPGSKDTRKRAKEIVSAGPLTTTFFACMEKALAPLLKEISEGRLDAADLLWRGALKAAGREAWHVARAGLGEGTRAIRSVAKYEDRFANLLRSTQTLNLPGPSTGQPE